MSDIVLLESDLAKLTKDRLIYGFGKKEHKKSLFKQRVLFITRISA
jgi:hypothetical protein